MKRIECRLTWPAWSRRFRRTHEHATSPASEGIGPSACRANSPAPLSRAALVSVILLLSVCPWPCSGGDSPDDSVVDRTKSSQEEQPPRGTGAAPPPTIPEMNLCGVNSLYMFLRAWGESFSVDDVKQVTRRSADGSSLRDIHEAASMLGVETKIYQCNLDDLRTRCPLPAIALFRPQGTKKSVGHFVVLLSVGSGPEGRVSWIDGTIGYRLSKRTPAFLERWTGYVLARPDAFQYEPALMYLTLINGGGWMMAVLWWERRGKKGSGNNPMSLASTCRHLSGED